MKKVGGTNKKFMTKEKLYKFKLKLNLDLFLTKFNHNVHTSDVSVPEGDSRYYLFMANVLVPRSENQL